MSGRFEGVCATAVGVACVLPLFLVIVAAQPGRSTVAIDANDIGGMVASAGGPEAGVWVIAETTDLPTKFAQIVVTDHQGRYVLPDLPNASYSVWVRGYGLVDSPRVEARPGQPLNLTAVVAPNERAAAEYYPPSYWLSLMRTPDGDPDMAAVKAAVRCALGCHQMGGKATREITPATETLGPFESTREAWVRRMRAGAPGAFMARYWGRYGVEMYPDWTDRIAAGEVPTAPPRPTGIQRNLVISMWDWGPINGFIHDAAPADKRNPVVPPGTLIYGPGQMHDTLYWLDPVNHTDGAIEIPTRDNDLRALPRDGLGGPLPLDMGRDREPSAYWGDEEIWMSVSEPRSGQMDHRGRVWAGFRIRRDEKQPAFCRSGSTNKFAKYFPLDPRPRSNIGGKQTGFFDPKTQQWTLIDTCWWFDHNDFVEDADNTLYSGMNDVLGWINTRVFDETGDEQAAQGWCPAVLDTNGDGTITEWTEPDEPIDPDKDHRISFTCYSVGASPLDQSGWCNGTGRQIVRIERGPSPPETCKAEVYQVPDGHPASGSRGIEVDSQGVVWVNFTDADYVGAFDRSQCRVLNGPTATGQHCPEGWSFYDTVIGPTFDGTGMATDRTYLLNVDRFGALGLGREVPVTYPENSDALIALSRETNEWVVLRVPYPMGAIFTKQVHGRIDDPLGGWKGRGLWANTGNYALPHVEGGKGTRGKVLKFQLRPDPLAK